MTNYAVRLAMNLVNYRWNNYEIKSRLDYKILHRDTFNTVRTLIFGNIRRLRLIVEF
ncbi:MAG: hypothetical protein LBB88_04680 [Planctomycetaceae bacterium]|nr:hypothetical protein [Planctomycetaceae bacterium]